MLPLKVSGVRADTNNMSENDTQGTTTMTNALTALRAFHAIAYETGAPIEPSDAAGILGGVESKHGRVLVDWEATDELDDSHDHFDGFVMADGSLLIPTENPGPTVWMQIPAGDWQLA